MTFIPPDLADAYYIDYYIVEGFSFRCVQIFVEKHIKHALLTTALLCIFLGSANKEWGLKPDCYVQANDHGLQALELYCSAYFELMLQLIGEKTKVMIENVTRKYSIISTSSAVKPAGFWLSQTLVTPWSNSPTCAALAKDKDGLVVTLVC